MPVFEYRCTDCQNQYEVLHLGRENALEIVCPQCNSKNYSKLFSVFSSSVESRSGHSSGGISSGPGCACGNGGCFN